jgi:hypothetical protein
MGSVRLIEKEAAAWKETAAWKEAAKWTKWRGSAKGTETVIATGTETGIVFRSRVVLPGTADALQGALPYSSRRSLPFRLPLAALGAVFSKIRLYGSGTETASGSSRSI